MSMMRMAAFSAGMMVVGAGGACGQDFPNKPIRIFATSAGGGSDFTSRLIAQGISAPLGQPVIVENRGGGGVISAETVARAMPDGYNLLAAGSFHIASLLQTTSYDPVRDFSPITLTNSQPNVLVVDPSLPVKSVKELIALAKTKPGSLNYSSAGSGGSSNLSGELFKSLTGVNIVHVPYRGSAPAINALLAGEVHLMFIDGGPLAPHIKSGRLRALAVTSAQPSALYPSLPTLAATVPGFESTGITGLFAPAKTPAAIINRLNREIVRLLNTAEAKEQLFNSGNDTVASSPEELGAFIKSDMARWGKLIKEVGIKAE